MTLDDFVLLEEHLKSKVSFFISGLSEKHYCDLCMETYKKYHNRKSFSFFNKKQNFMEIFQKIKIFPHFSV